MTHNRNWEYSCDALSSEVIENRKLAISYQDIKFRKRGQSLTLLGSVLTLFGLAVGGYQFYDQIKSREDTRQQEFEASIALEFFSLASDDQAGFAANVANFGGTSVAFIDKLYSALPKTSDVTSDDQTTLQPDVVGNFNAIVDQLQVLQSNETSTRRSARANLAQAIAECPNVECYNLLNNSFNPKNLVTSASYRTALGITVALQILATQRPTNFDASVARFDQNGAIHSKLELLSNNREPAIKNAATVALKGFE